jgi:hypothetical protein
MRWCYRRGVTNSKKPIEGSVTENAPAPNAEK